MIKKLFKTLIIIGLLFTTFFIQNATDVQALSYTVKTTGLNRHFNPSKQEIIKKYSSLITDAPIKYDVLPNYSTGSEAGKININTLNNATNYTNYLRYIAGVNPITHDATKSMYAQAATFVLSYIEYGLSHNPESDYKDQLDQTNLSSTIRTQGNHGAKNSNISLYIGGQQNLEFDLDHFMYDSDNSNRGVVGHRNHLISPAKQSMGFGFTNGQNYGSRGAVYVDSGEYMNLELLKDTVVAWPSTYQPIEAFRTLGDNIPVFSVQFGYQFAGSSKFSLSNANITLKRLNDGVTIPLAYKNIDEGSYHVITFSPANTHQYKVGEVYEVTITGVTKGGTNYPINYTVEFIDDTVQKELTSIAFNKLLKKLNYVSGESLDLSGNVMKLTYSDGSTELKELPLTYVSGFNPETNSYGTQRVTVDYQGFKAQYNVTVTRFKDILLNHWAYTPIETLAQLGIISGFPDQTFRPNANLTRAEAVKMIVGAINLDITGASSNFTDVPSTSWAYGFISAAKEAGIISGYLEGSFKPNGQITRAEISKMIVNAFNVQNGTNIVSFSDVPSTSWAYDLITKLSSNGIIRGYPDETFKPNNLVTRSEFSSMLLKAIEY